jgi:hypothetical protein
MFGDLKTLGKCGDREAMRVVPCKMGLASHRRIAFSGISKKRS